jgi:hypothetical protein
MLQARRKVQAMNHVQTRLTKRRLEAYTVVANEVLQDTGLATRNGPVKNRKMSAIILGHVSTLLSSFGGVAETDPTIRFATPEYETLAKTATTALMQGPTVAERKAALIDVMIKSRNIYDSDEAQRGYVDTTDQLKAEAGFLR